MVTSSGIQLQEAVVVKKLSQEVVVARVVVAREVVAREVVAREVVARVVVTRSEK